MRRHVVNFHCERWQMPDGGTMMAALPDGIDGTSGRNCAASCSPNTIKGR